MQLKDRKRTIDLNSMAPEQVDDLSQQIGERVRNICDEAALKVNSILNVYGMSAKIAIEFNTLGEQTSNETETSGSIAKSDEQDNL